MRDPGQQLRRFAASWRGDTVLAAAQVASVVGYLLLAGTAVDRRWLALVYVLPNAAALPARRRWPLAAVAMACAALLVVRPFGLGPAVNDLPGLLFDWTPFLFAYSLGNGAGLAAGLVGSAALVGSLQIVNGVFNPIFEVMVLAGWLAGRMVASRRKLSEQLQTRNDELQAERELFAAEAVRYERARIAREVHDIVAHCLSLMVVQASAGQRSTGDGVTEALVSVADAAAQAQSEIGRLAELLAGEPAPGSSPRLQMVDELVHRAAVTGLAVTCRFTGACDQLSPAASEAAYRVVQEALTNALKHAPGAPVDITIGEQDSQVHVDILNGAAVGHPSGLESSGGGYGLTGMRERVTACGGTLTYGPTAAGGWQVSALLASVAGRSGRPV